MLPLNLDQYNAETFKKEAEKFATSELEAGAVKLIETTPGAQEMYNNAQFVNDNFLKGIPKLSLSDIKDLTLADGEEITEAVLVNVANYYDIPITSLKVEEWLDQGVDYLKAEGEELLMQASVEALAYLGVESVSSTISSAAPMVGLATTTYEALEDGNLSTGEALSIGSTAATAASTVLAGTAAVGLAAVGGIVGAVAIGVAFLEASNAAQEEFLRQAREYAKAKTGYEADRINKFLEEAAVQFNSAEAGLWDRTENSIGSVAKDWSTFEQRLDTSFQLRFFPGAPPPVRGGWKTKAYSRENDIWYYKSVACTNQAGCLYFPGSDSFTKAGNTVLFLREMEKHGLHSPIDPEHTALNPYQFKPAAYGNGYEYYWRTLRAFDALVPNRPDSLGRPSGVWVHPGHERRSPMEFKDYGYLAYERYCWIKGQCNYTYARDKYSIHSIATPVPSKCLSATGCSDIGEAVAEQSYYHETVYNKRAWARDVEQDAIDYVDELFEGLHGMSKAVDTFRTRVQGDLIQTASAVKGEQATRNRLEEIARQVGYRPEDFRKDPAAKQDVYMLDNTSREILVAMEETQKRSNLLNIAMVAGGGSLFSIGMGAWLAKKK